MNCLLIRLPSKKWESGRLPLDELYTASAIERCGHHVEILDLQGKKNGLFEFDSGNYACFEASVSAGKPQMIFLSGSYGAYKRAKIISEYIGNKYPKIIQAVSAGTLTFTYQYLLKNSRINLVLHGDVEVILPPLLEAVSNNQSYKNTPGISFLEAGIAKRNEDAGQIAELDDIPIPNYDLVNVTDYYESIQERVHAYEGILSDYGFKDECQKRLAGKEKLLWIVPSRGCINKCSFCCLTHKHKGMRIHSVDYVIRYIKYLITEYHVDGIAFGGNVFNADEAWVDEFCEKLAGEKLNIVYHIAAARIDRMSDKLLGKLKDTGCFSIIYGQESGSDKILKEYRKNTSVQQNLEITALTIFKYKILSPIQIVIGAPGEDDDTVRETIEFLKRLRVRQLSVKYLMPLPETMIWKHVVKNNLIEDIDHYLENIDDNVGEAQVNLTKVSDWRWRRWGYRIYAELQLDHLKRVYSHKYYLCRILFEIFIVVRPFLSNRRVLSIGKFIAKT